METRWNICDNDRGIVWKYRKGDLHTDDVEMAGFRCADIVTYGMRDDGFVLSHHPIYPSLRLRPNNTHATYQMDIPEEDMPKLRVNGEPVVQTLDCVIFDGALHVDTVDETHGIRIGHRCFPSADLRLSIEEVTVENAGCASISLTCDGGNREVDRTLGPMGVNILEVRTTFDEVVLRNGEHYTYYIVFSAHLANEATDVCDLTQEYAKRMARVRELTDVLTLDTGNAALDTMFYFAKLRAGESVFRTRYGLVHSPGGKNFYAATWCNDEVEYAGPYFAYTGDAALLEASMNAYRMYRPFMSSAYQPIPSSVIAEGLDYWNGAGDRGDAAMYLYGASRFALTAGKKAYAEELLPAIEWCAEYCRRKTNENGVVESDCDELENRFPAGQANLCTSVLAYDGYRSAAILESEFGKAELAGQYTRLADALAESIDHCFSHRIHGFDTYRYYDGCEILRSWICLPLCVGLDKHAEGTVRALTSEYLMRPEGFLTTEERETIWDRSTLYGLRGIFASGQSDVAMDLLARYCNTRLLGERVPYAVEAYPEGGRRQLSGESALFCKVVIDGILNIRPEGLNRFSIKPILPNGLGHLYLSDIKAFGITFAVRLNAEGYAVIQSDGTVLAKARNGEKRILRTY